jgi:phage shock protein PspC (stress-responsive transcriptional regulator)
MPVDGMPPPSLRQLLFVLLLLAGVIGVPVCLIIWLAVTVMEWLR